MDQCESIKANGFAILPNLFSPPRTDRLLSEIVSAEPRRSRAGVRHAMSLAPVASIAQDAALLEIARGALGTEAFPFRATLFDKSPTSNWLVVWHQDTALPLRERLEISGWGPWSVKEGINYAHAPADVLARIVALRIHLDDSTTDNGPLRVLPRTHNLGVLSDDQLSELALRITPVDCIASKGGVVAMHPLVVHSSSKSRTDMPRRVLHIEYAASERIGSPLQLAMA